MNELLENLISLTKKTTTLILEQLNVVTKKVTAELNKPSNSSPQEAPPVNVATAPKTETVKEEPAKTAAPEAPKKEVPPVKLTVAPAKTDNLPEDSILKRHAAQLKAAATQTVATKSAPVAPAKPAVSEVPTDSILRRHYEALHK